ncbi:MAG: WbqC family protein [Cyclobacteriaceae bacterium]
MRSVLLEPHYLPSIEYFTILSQADRLIWDVDSRFQKQTYRNRTYLLSANGVLPLIVPVSYHQDTKFKDVRIDYSQDWIRQHRGAFYSAYGKSPFFEYFSDHIHSCWEAKPKYLVDLNHAFLSVCFRVLQWQIDILIDHSENAPYDLRDKIRAKESYECRQYYEPSLYVQNFGNTFVPNLSILDLLMCQGPESGKILRDSIQTPIERFQG